MGIKSGLSNIKNAAIKTGIPAVTSVGREGFDMLMAHGAVAQKKAHKIRSNNRANGTDIVQSAMNKMKNSENGFIQALAPNGTSSIPQSVSADVAKDAAKYVRENPKRPQFDKGLQGRMAHQKDSTYRELVGRMNHADAIGEAWDGTFERAKTGFENQLQYFGNVDNGGKRMMAAGAGIGAVAIGAGIVDRASDGEGGFGGAILGATGATAGIMGAVNAMSRRL